MRRLVALVVWCVLVGGFIHCGDDTAPMVDAGAPDAGCLDYCAAVVCPPELLCDAGMPHD